jgi:hypothetical protein
MSRVLKAITLLVLTSSLFWFRETANAQYLTGAAKVKVVADIMQCCVREYDRKPNNMPRPYAEKYCQCYAEGVVDHLPAEEFKDADSPASNEAISREAKRCYQIVRDEIMRSISR